MRAYVNRAVWGRGLLGLSLLSAGACAVGDEDMGLFSGPTSAATMYGSSGDEGAGEAETSGASSTTDASSTDTGATGASSTDTGTTDASTDTTASSGGDGDTEGDVTSTGDGDETDGSGETTTDSSDASTDTTDASTDTTDASTDTTDASTDTTDASTDTTDASTDTTDASTATTDASTDSTGGDGDGDTGTTGGSGMCGDGALDSGEDCDDGNGSNNDGCSSSCTWEANCGTDNPQPAISCGGQGNGNMSGAYSDVDQPVCGQTFAWQDRVYVYVAQTSGSVTATFTSSPDPGDGAIVVMEGSCHNQLCIASSLDSGNYHSVTWDAIAGLTYYIDLELPSQQPSFSISMSCG